MKLIDYELFGNVVRFYIGENDLTDWYGDDWDDRPFEDNAGSVYDEYVAGYIDVAWGGNFMVTEPVGLYFSKDDMKARKLPMVAVTPVLPDTYRWEYDYKTVVSSPDVVRFYMGDNDVVTKQLIQESGGMVLNEHINGSVSD